MSIPAGTRVVHLTTSDMSLALLLGPQLRAFAAAGMDVIGASAPGPWVDGLGAWGVRHEPVAHATRSVAPRHDAMALAELVRLFRRLRPDIVHTHNPKPGVYGRLAARLARVPIVVNTVHGLYATADDSWSRRTTVYGLERLASVCSDAELVQNEEDVATLERLRVPQRKLVPLGNGVDLERFRPPSADEVAQARRELGIRAGDVVAGVVGRLVWEKGYAELFAAARRLRQTRPNVVVIVVGPTDPAKGDGLTEADLAAAKELGNVVVLGERRDVERLYRAFDLFVLPSHREGFPRAAMEASASGVPVIATDIRGCRQVVDHGVSGLLVPVRDAEGLASAMEALADDPVRRRSMGDAARRQAETEFDDQRVIRRTLEVYTRLLVKAGRPKSSAPPPVHVAAS
jgi:glycosyltransferase involved in cell wall biosynthesis